MALLEASGLTVVTREDHRAAMVAMVAQIARRLALTHSVLRAGLPEPHSGPVDEGLVELGERLAAAASHAVESGALGYALLLARAQG